MTDIRIQQVAVFFKVTMATKFQSFALGDIGIADVPDDCNFEETIMNVGTQVIKGANKLIKAYKDPTFQACLSNHRDVGKQFVKLQEANDAD